MPLQLHATASFPATPTDLALLLPAGAPFPEAIAGQLTELETAYIAAEQGHKNSLITVNRYRHRLYIMFVPDKPTPEAVREGVRKLGHQLVQKLAAARVNALHLLGEQVDQALVLALAEGIALSAYHFAPYKTIPPDPQPVRLADVFLIGAATEAVEWLQAVVTGVYLTRDLVNTPFNYQSATQLAEQFTEAGDKAGFTTEILDEPRIQSLKMGGLLAVNQGSPAPPTFTIMEWAPDNALNTKPIVLVGKGVVFDTGGLSLKPTPNSMDLMKSDMAGGAAVAGVLSAVAQAQLPLRVVGLVPATDNRPGEEAFAPGDVITMHNGRTVEITNTDAEGRLLLADALSFAARYEPELVLDVATLTGAAARAVGKEGVVVMGTAGDETMQQLKLAGNAVYERLVELPLWEEYAEQIKSDFADYRHYQPGADAGAISAGKFLEVFTSYPWVHFDIAGSAFLTAPDSYRGKGGTGAAVRLLCEFLRERAAKA